MRGLCLCRTCQKISGGAGNLFIGLEADGFRYSRGEPRRFTHPEAADAPTREFCGDCGVHIAARSPRAPGGLIVKVGALDDPAVFEGPSLVVWTEDKHDFHMVPEGARAFPRVPGRP
ncbi:GFA family protein [Phenylobacterium sp.]|uniref:GFA family protein n=1 Tax=Phenylobacterium sp. TaxID=1871053 RepID=UPI003568478D